jgi:hypothetical protein
MADSVYHVEAPSIWQLRGQFRVKNVQENSLPETAQRRPMFPPNRLGFIGRQGVDLK